MSWHIVDDSLLERLAHQGLSIEHAFLHLEALAYCSRLGTDGILPADLSRVSRISEPIHGAAALWSVGLWQPHPLGGWEIVGYLDEQRSAARIEEDKQRARERADRSRRHKSGDHSLCRSSYCNHAPPDNPGARDVRRTFSADARGPYLISSDLTDEISSNESSGADRAPAEARATEPKSMTVSEGVLLARQALDAARNETEPRNK
jgi:hypothetical protein